MSSDTTALNVQYKDEGNLTNDVGTLDLTETHESIETDEVEKKMDDWVDSCFVASC
ncbi:hypothetical protein C499_14000 [Halogeometricum borinquense DSM 11551]|uniref:Uncharacterized protein n=1 Tax=Halogeometricum borinquense (strain ATCC 700274 / DSM 11551 / JCM 10706 / KCTC 4070 / PR3) TaxID=469382 RepID=E4NU07_HALBP|nr:hypothetical protein [Halogeometricum borinquense]ADQ68527.1 hypothetical protein Hbor_29900 [Halogeometricum borinquense DSM 11551]ELY25601.1 hypothetical protein C499_14000 [Halogeometricum borinquense DSM 11551]